jgi:hypothetical protein
MKPKRALTLSVIYTVTIVVLGFVWEPSVVGQSPTLVSINSNHTGNGNAPSYGPNVSGDGRFVVSRAPPATWRAMTQIFYIGTSNEGNGH